MIKIVCCLFLSMAISGCRTQANVMSQRLEISYVAECPVVRLAFENRSNRTIYFHKDPPSLSIVDDSGSIVRESVSPAYFFADDLSNYVALAAGKTHVEIIQLALAYDLKPGKEYTLDTRGGEFTDPVTHEHVLIQGENVKKKFYSSSKCVKEFN